jgi:hypothetical protein
MVEDCDSARGIGELGKNQNMSDVSSLRRSEMFKS